MTPQERQLVDELFDRLAKLENVPRDAAAERAIADGLKRAPHAVYALVQTALLQDEALKRANARIEELQAQAGGAQESEQPPGSFLDSMREALTGHAPARGSVPSIRPAAPSSPSPGYQSQNFQPQGNQAQPGYPPPPPGYSPNPVGPAFGSGGSFLGTAASTAAGFIGGALLLDGIRSMFGHHFGGYGPSASGDLAGDRASPWSASTAGSAADSQLARDAGIEHVGDHLHDAGNDPSQADQRVDPTDADPDPFQTADDEDFTDDDDFADDGNYADDSYDA